VVESSESLYAKRWVSMVCDGLGYSCGEL
jgi:hypothetical protein